MGVDVPDPEEQAPPPHPPPAQVSGCDQSCLGLFGSRAPTQPFFVGPGSIYAPVSYVVCILLCLVFRLLYGLQRNKWGVVLGLCLIDVICIVTISIQGVLNTRRDRPITSLVVTSTTTAGLCLLSYLMSLGAMNNGLEVIFLYPETACSLVLQYYQVEATGSRITPRTRTNLRVFTLAMTILAWAALAPFHGTVVTISAAVLVLAFQFYAFKMWHQSSAKETMVRDQAQKST
eukprot:g10557.t1